MSSARASTQTADASEVSGDAQASSDNMTEDELIAHVLAGAAGRVREAVERLVQMGVINEAGKVLATELPRDMRPDSLTTVVTG